MHKLIKFIKYPIAIALLYFLFTSGRIELSVLADFLNARNAMITMAVFIIWIAHDVVFSLRYQFVLDALGYKAKLIDIFNATMVGIFSNNFVPGGAGIDIARIYYLKKSDNVPISGGMAVAVLDRSLGFCGLVLVSAILLPLMLAITQVDTTFLATLKILFIALVALAIVLLSGIVVLRLDVSYSFIQRLFARWTFTSRALPFISAMHLLVLNNRVMLASISYSMVGRMLTIASAALLTYSLYGTKAAYAMIAMHGIMQLLIAIPITPANIGWTELVSDELLHLFGTDGGANIAIVGRVMAVLYSLIGGVIYLRLKGNNRTGLM
ncbi:hypothetical protein RsTz2092_00090 [Deferribacterales bacterium RsTz2092]|nr:hypothetical protein AGMMS49941_00420 [Deferribacterales bacterium]